MAKEKKSKQAQFIKWMGPLLDALRELGGSGRPKEVEDIIASKFGVTDAQRQERNKTGPLKFSNQVAWCKLYLVYEGLLVCPKRGIPSLQNNGNQNTTLPHVRAKRTSLWQLWRAGAKRSNANNKLSYTAVVF